MKRVKDKNVGELVLITRILHEREAIVYNNWIQSLTYIGIPNVINCFLTKGKVCFSK